MSAAGEDLARQERDAGAIKARPDSAVSGAQAIERLTEHVWRLPLPVSTLPPYDHTNGYLIADNGVGMFVDPVCENDDGLAMLKAAVRAAGVKLLKGIVLSHTHPDHVVGLPTVVTEFDGPALYVHAAEAARLGSELGSVVVVEDRVLTVGDVTVELLHTPGHSPGHLALSVRSAPGDVLEAVLAGDLVAADSSVWVGVPEGDVSAYLASLERLAKLMAPVIGAGHGPALREPQQRLEELRAHRLEREAQIVQALADGAASASAISERLYQEATGTVADLARRSVLAHLKRLVAAGRVSRSGPDDDATFSLSPNADSSS